MSRKTALLIIVALSALGLLTVFAPLELAPPPHSDKFKTFIMLHGKVLSRLYKPILPWLYLCFSLAGLTLAGGIMGLAGRAFKTPLAIVSGAGAVLTPLVIISYPGLVWFNQNRTSNLFKFVLAFFKEPQRVLNSLSMSLGMALPLLTLCFIACFVMTLLMKKAK